MGEKKRFAIMGCGGYIAPRHLKAIQETGNKLVCALDKSDSVGILDSYSYDVDFFTEFERFDRYMEKLRQGGGKIDFVSICTPNYLHDAHIRFALRNGADAICEKPLVQNPWNLDALEEVEKELGKKIYGIMQLRLHPSIKSLKEKVEKEYSGGKYEIELKYIASRGKWYLYSWKGDEKKSGGLAMNIGIHFFDMLLWIFGKVENFEVYCNEQTKMEGYLELEKAKVKWILSCDKENLPQEAIEQGKTTYRSIKVDGEEMEFTEGFADLHTKAYEEILAGRGFRIKDIRPVVELIYELRNALVIQKKEEKYFVHETSQIDEGVKIGEGTKVWHFSHILKNSKIGDNCVIGQNCSIGPEVEIGNQCKIQNNVSIYKGISLEEGVFCGPSIVFTNVNTPRAFVDRSGEFEKTIVKKGATIGANATIVCGHNIGRYSLIGAGSVVTKDILNHAVVVGNPAKQIGWVCECGVVLTKELSVVGEKILKCKRCGKGYLQTREKVVFRDK